MNIIKCDYYVYQYLNKNMYSLAVKKCEASIVAMVIIYKRPKPLISGKAKKILLLEWFTGALLLGHLYKR